MHLLLVMINEIELIFSRMSSRVVNDPSTYPVLLRGCHELKRRGRSGIFLVTRLRRGRASTSDT